MTERVLRIDFEDYTQGPTGGSKEIQGTGKKKKGNRGKGETGNT
jgi:hypothetical protein